ncbi:universal stress protein [Paucibacter sp. APW11]|uniref:Universal stress protein n=1 Tax=Roseateles aquae TaxID=3077235 RepID=A0ABU3PDI9_9BURK|nr:universal stress protein [Paucibacter sp. APW11]MDT9000669.1 universal stress protein [Paucibacter sp. APW11]
MFKRILLPTDGSTTAARAAAVAVDLARRYGAQLEIVSVIDPVPFVSFPEGGGEALAYYLEAAEEGASIGIKAAEALASAAGVGFASHVLREHGPAVSIVEHAQACAADLIVIGSHGRRGLDAVLLGSVAQKVLTLSKVPVFVVK